MTLKQLRYIVEIAKHNSFSKAAEKLYVSQPSVSKAVSDLEKELKIKIFERARRGVKLTAEGSELLGYAKQLLEQAETIEARFTDKPPAKSLHFSVSAQHYVFTVDAFISFLKSLKHEDYEISLREGKASEIIEDVVTQKSELGILFVSETLEHFMGRVFSSKDIEFHPIKRITPHAFLSNNHPLACQDEVTLDQSIIPLP